MPDTTITDSGGTISAVRYYTIGGVTVAVRTSGGQVEYLTGNQQGTATLAIDSATLAATHRYYDPNGNPVGPAPGSWPGNRGFVNGTTDPVTGLVNLGAREYNPATTTFLTTDSIQLPYNPQDLNPCAYTTPQRDGALGREPHRGAQGATPRRPQLLTASRLRKAG